MKPLWYPGVFANEVAAAAENGPLPVLMAVGLAGWVGVANAHFALLTPELCISGDWLGQAPAGAASVLTLNPPAQTVTFCLVMLMAMMTPLLARPIGHLCRHGTVCLRVLAIACFVTTYAGIWLLAACALLAVAVALKGFSAAIALPAPAVATVIALIWQAAPVKWTCLERCHRLPRLSPLCATAALDCVRFGAATALWCIGACWALMLVPFVVEGMHVAAMAGVAALMFAERHVPAGWRRADGQSEGHRTVEPRRS